MLFSILLLAIVVFLSYRIAPREREEDAHVHGAGQVGLLAAVALFGVDYFTSFFYATGEMMTALHPYGLPHGPQPGATEASIGKQKTDELAVIVDTFHPLQIALSALEFEKQDYMSSWLDGSGE